MLGSVLAAEHLRRKQVNTPGCEVVQREWVTKIDDQPVHFIPLIICDVGHYRVKTGRLNDTEKANVVDELPQT